MPNIDRYGKIKIAAKKNDGQGYVRKWQWRRVTFRLVAALLLFGSLAGLLRFGPPLYRQYHQISSRLETILHRRYNRLLGAEVVVRPGDDGRRLVKRFSSLGYTRHQHSPLPPESYAIQGDEVLISLKSGAPMVGTFRVDLDQGHVRSITTEKDGRSVPELALGRPLLTSFTDSIWEVRFPVSYKALPVDLKTAITATEDAGFFHHPGLDIRGICRAAWVDLLHGRVVQGGSTITQQLVKTLMHRTGRDVGEKVQEMLLALLVDYSYSKEQILAAYCNTIYMGQIGPFALHGMGAASRYLLGKDLSELSRAECALLAGLIHAPNALSPLRHPEAAAARAGTVLSRMHDAPYSAGTGSFPTLKFAGQDQDSGDLMSQAWYYRQVEEEIASAIKRRTQGPLTVYLALDPVFQHAAQKVLNRRLAKLEKGGHFRLQGAIAAIDVASGGVRALIGGRDFSRNQFNRAVDARRQIGSLVKPFVYLAAMPMVTGPAQARIVDDTALRRRISGRIWRPLDYDRRFLGPITWRRALAESRNIPAVRIGELAGIDKVRGLIRSVGINETPESGPALFLGAVDSSPLRMAAAYRTLASGGRYAQPFLVERIEAQGHVILRADKDRRILDAGRAYVMTDMLKSVLTRGTARSAPKRHLPGAVAGKTGTSSNLRDGWFAGFSPDLAIAVWVGRDSNKPMGRTGAASALPIWAEVLGRFAGKMGADFTVPDSVTFASMDPKNGRIGGPDDRHGIRIACLAKRQPLERVEVDGLATAGTNGLTTIGDQSSKNESYQKPNGDVDDPLTVAKEKKRLERKMQKPGRSKITRQPVKVIHIKRVASAKPSAKWVAKKSAVESEKRHNQHVRQKKYVVSDYGTPLAGQRYRYFKLAPSRKYDKRR